ncbi:Ig-like domain-containing protein [Lacrimispora sp.]|uniref:Ig-like domain-containing protein n=1 Tax=Lacrimispora sp. TaxID=2719234 RepID=UPI0028A5B243|nr:Ig-like domain-containing protein [Lacrimispora sp.]
MSVKTVQATLNGQTYNLTLNSSTGAYEATITAPSTSSYPLSGHYYPVSIKAEDTAGNVTTKDATDSTLGSSLRLTVKEKVAPVITITAPTASALITNNKPAITWNITDDDSGVDPDTIKLTIDSTVVTSGITKTASGKGFTCSYTPPSALADGSHTIKADASDYDGNAASQKNVTFKIDTVPPTLNVTAPANNLITNQAACTVTGNTNDVTSSPVTVTVKLNSGSAADVTVNGDGTFSKPLTLAEGANTITIVAKDGAGKTTTVTRAVILDTAAPVISEVSLVPNPVDAGKTFVLSVKVTD